MTQRRWWQMALRQLPWWFALAFLVVGLLAPLLANDVPIVAKVAGTWHFPAVADLFSSAPPGPGDLDWKLWWSRLASDSNDWALMPPWPYGPLETDAARFRAGPSFAHLLGCDDTGRDVLARLIHGANTAATLALPAVLIGGIVGTTLGVVAGYWRGIADELVMRLIELTLCFPMLLFLLFAAALFGSSSFGVIAVTAAVFWPSFARIVRGELLSLRERDFVAVARGLGLSEWRVFVGHLLPQIVSQIGVTAAFCFAAAIVAESTLSFLGVGPDVASSWGAMLLQGTQQAVVGAWHLWFFPAVAIVSVVVCCHVLADRLRAEPEDEAAA